MSVRAFQAPNVRTVYPEIFLTNTGRWDHCQLHYAVHSGLKQEMYRAPFLFLSSCHVDEQCGPKEGCSVTQTTAEIHPCVNPDGRATI